MGLPDITQLHFTVGISKGMSERLLSVSARRVFFSLVSVTMCVATAGSNFGSKVPPCLWIYARCLESGKGRKEKTNITHAPPRPSRGISKITSCVEYDKIVEILRGLNGLDRELGARLSCLVTIISGNREGRGSPCVILFLQSPRKLCRCDELWLGLGGFLSRCGLLCCRDN